MFCRHCGKELLEGSNFCSYCGKPMTEALPVQGHQAALTTMAESKPASLIDFVNPLNGSSFRANMDEETLKNLNAECKSDKDYKDWINRFDSGLNPVIKDALKGLVKFTVKAGKFIFSIGKIVLNIVMKIVSEFAHTVMGLVAGFVLGLLFSSIPLLGWVLGPFITPLLVATGGIVGFMQDMGTKLGDYSMEEKLRSSVFKVAGAMGLSG